MRRAAWHHAFFTLALVLLGASLDAVPAAKEPPLPYLPDDTALGAPPREGEAWIYATSSVATRFERIDDATRLAFIVEKTGQSIDPFTTRPERKDSYVTFRFDIENRSESVVVFQPLNCRIYSPMQNGWRGPIDLPALQSTYAVFEQPMPEAFYHVGKALFDGQVLLNPGEKRTGLLVFPAVEPRLKSFRVEVGWTTADGRHEGFEAPYARPSKPKK